MISTPALPPTPQPPNPPMFGSQFTNQAGQNQRNTAGMGTGFEGTILGNTNPANTGQKTLLGQ